MTELVLFLDVLEQFLRPTTLVGVLIDGLSKAALYAMIAGGLTLIFGLMGVLNFAHGSLTMIGAYLAGLVMVTAVTAATSTGARLAYFFVAVVVVFAALALLGGVIEVGLIRPLYDRPPIYQILLTFGVALVLDELMRIVTVFYDLQPITDWQQALGTKPEPLARSVDLTAVDVAGVSVLALFVGGTVAGAVLAVLLGTDRGAAALGGMADRLPERTADGGERLVAVGVGVAVGLVGVLAVAAAGMTDVTARGLALFNILVGIIVVGTIWLFLTRTRYGLVVRAGSEDAEMAEALGIDVRRVFTTVFALGIGIAGVAGALLMWDPNWGASVPLAAETLLPAFVVVIIGGLGTFRGTVVAALIVGLTDAVMTWWFINHVDFSGLPEMTIFLILVVTLVVRPQGLFGVAEVGGH